LFGNVNAGQGIRGAGPARDHTDPWLSGQFAVCISHHGSTAFLTTNSHFDIDVNECVKYRQKAFARDTKHVLHTVADQLADKNLTASAGIFG
jgi:hypothetical protein